MERRTCKQGGFTYDANAAFTAMELAFGSPSSTFGAFSVGYGITPGSFIAFSAAQHTDSFLANASIQGYYIANPQSVPAAMVNTSSTQSVLAGSGIAPIDAGQIFMHPGAINFANAEGGPIQNSILRFTAPTAGTYSIFGDQLCSRADANIVCNTAKARLSVAPCTAPSWRTRRTLSSVRI